MPIARYGANIASLRDMHPTARKFETFRDGDGWACRLLNPAGEVVEIYNSLPTKADATLRAKQALNGAYFDLDDPDPIARGQAYAVWTGFKSWLRAIHNTRRLEAAAELLSHDAERWRTSGNGKKARQVERDRAALIPLLHSIGRAGRPRTYDDMREPVITKIWLCEQLLDWLENPDPEFEQGVIAQALLDDGFDPQRLPSAATLAEEKHWFGSWATDQLRGVPDPESGDD